MIFRDDAHEVELREKMRGGEGTVKLTKLFGALPEHARLFSRISLEPGVSIGYHVHENETELFYFLSGRGRVRDDESWFDVQAGDAMSTGSGHGHCVENTGDEALHIVAVIVKD